MKSEEKVPLMIHLEELRRRLIISAIAIGIAFVACTFVSTEVYGFLAAPLIKALPEGSSMSILKPQEGFFTYLKVALLAGLIAAVPVITSQIWLFISPALYKKERGYFVSFVFFSTFFFMAGVAFAYWVVFPFAFRFFMGYAQGAIRAAVSMEWYLAFAGKLLLAFGLVFELPIFTFFFARLGIITPQLLTRNFKFAVVGMFTMAAILTPPDVFTQMMMAGPLMLLYGISIVVAAVAGKKRSSESAEDAGEEEEKEKTDNLSAEE